MPDFHLSGGGTLHFEELGAGPPLLLIHGWPVSSVYWRTNMSRLAESFRVVVIDVPGFGRSSCPSQEGCSCRQQADRIAEFMAATFDGPVHLAGHSMGGMISSHIARNHPHLVRRLVLVTAPVEGASALSPLGQLGRFWWARLISAWALGFALVRKATAFWFAHAARVSDEILQAAGEASPASARLALQAITSEGGREQLASIQCPTLIIGADRDQVVNPLQFLLAKAWIPGSEIEVFRDCGHCPNLEYPEQFEEILKGFLLREQRETPLGRAA